MFGSMQSIHLSIRGCLYSSFQRTNTGSHESRDVSIASSQTCTHLFMEGKTKPEIHLGKEGNIQGHSDKKETGMKLKKADSKKPDGGATIAVRYDSESIAN